MPTYTDGQVDTAAAAVPAPYGPLTRVTTMATLPEPNDQYLIELTDNNSNTIFAHYSELTDAERILEILYQANGYNAVMHASVLELEAIIAAYPADDVNGLYTYEDYKAFVYRLKQMPVSRNFL